MTNNSFGSRLKNLVKTKDLTVVKFCEMVHLSPTNVYKYFNDQVVPTITVLQKIVQIWPDINLRWLLLGEGEPFSGENGKDLSEKVKSLENIIEDKELIIQLLKDKLENQKI